MAQAEQLGSFTTTWDYTTLKLLYGLFYWGYGFTTTWDYTTLKRREIGKWVQKGFTTTWDYTTLKQVHPPEK